MLGVPWVLLTFIMRFRFGLFLFGLLVLCFYALVLVNQCLLGIVRLISFTSDFILKYQISSWFFYTFRIQRNKQLFSFFFILFYFFNRSNPSEMIEYSVSC